MHRQSETHRNTDTHSQQWIVSQCHSYIHTHYIAQTANKIHKDLCCCAHSRYISYRTSKDSISPITHHRRCHKSLEIRDWQRNKFSTVRQAAHRKRFNKNITNMTILLIVQIFYKTKLAGYINWHDDMMMMMRRMMMRRLMMMRRRIFPNIDIGSTGN